MNPFLLLGFALVAMASLDYDQYDDQWWHENNDRELRKVLNIKRREWKAKNILLLIGDGYGNTERTASRIFQGQQRGEQGEYNELEMEKLLPYTGFLKTFSHDFQVPDSAPTAFAIYSGVKTKSDTFGYSGADLGGLGECDEISGDALPTMADFAKQAGKKVGLATNVRVTHATPGALYAKVPERDWEAAVPEDQTCDYQDIATQLLLSEVIDVALGGGARSFAPSGTRSLFNTTDSARTDDRDIIQEWQDKGGVFVSDRQSLLSLEPNDQRVLGLFADSAMQYAHEYDGSEPTLMEIANKALDLVEGAEEGYFLMIEGALIDWGGHDTNPPFVTYSDADHFDQTIKSLVDRIDLDETLVIATSDHGMAALITGYPENGNPICGYSKYVDYTPVQATIVYGAGPGFNQSDQAPPNNTNENFEPHGYYYPSALYDKVGWGRHGGDDVWVMANGPMAHLFTGVRMQTYISWVMQYASCTGHFEGENCEIVKSEKKDDDFPWVAVILPAAIVATIIGVGVIAIMSKIYDKRNN